MVPDSCRIVASLDRKRLGADFWGGGISIRGVFDKTSCASGAPPSMKIGFSGLATREMTSVDSSRAQAEAPVSAVLGTSML